MGNEAASRSYYRWQVPGKTVAVNLSLAVVARLVPAVRQAEYSASPRIPEIGGLLLGTVRRSHGMTIVEVDDFEPVACEHLSGPSYFLSGSDQRRLAGRVRLSRKRGAAVVGLFRSNTRREFALSVEDVDLMGSLFSNASMVMLLVDTPLQGPLRGGFFFWEQRSIRTMTTYLDFAFDVGSLPAERREAPSERKKLQWNHAAGRYASLLGAMGNWLRPVKATSFFRFEMAHAAEHSGKVPPAQTPSVFSQMWSYLPTRFRREWLVAAAALGIVVLGVAMHPESPHAAALTTITTQTAHEADRALPAAEPAPTEPVPVPLELPLQVETLQVFAASRAAPLPPPASAAKRVELPAAPPPAEAASVPSLPDAPELPLALPQPLEPVTLSSSLPAPVVAAPADPFVSVEVEPLISDRRRLLEKLRRVNRSETTVVPPRPVRQPLPEIPSALRQRIRDVVPINVNLYLDRAGAVEYAELVSDGTGANREIASLAVFTARHWQFSPAQQGGGPVPAKVLVRFRFGATADRAALIR
jgi:hypothetical protein